MAIPITLYESDGFSPAEAVVFRFWQNTPGTQTAYLKLDDGTMYVIPDTATISMLVTETWGAAATDLYFEQDCTVEERATGKFSITVSAATLTKPGLYLGEITVNLVDSPVKRFRCYVEVTPSLNSAQICGPLTIAEIRAAIRDRCAEDNYLLDRVEFQDGDILFAIRRPVDWWNETVPQGISTYSYSTFPFRYHWLDAVIGELLRIAGLQLSRNRMQLNGGGITSDDKARAELYLNIGTKMINEWKAWGISRMKRENMEKWTGYVRSGYF